MPLISRLPAGENYSRRSRIFSEENSAKCFLTELHYLSMKIRIQPFAQRILDGVGNFPKLNLEQLCAWFKILIVSRKVASPWRSRIFYWAKFSDIFHFMRIPLFFNGISRASQFCLNGFTIQNTTFVKKVIPPSLCLEHNAFMLTFLCRHFNISQRPLECKVHQNS